MGRDMAIADLRFPIMADVSYDTGVRQPDRDFANRRSPSRPPKVERRKTALLQAVEFQIVPQLVMAHQMPNPLRQTQPCPAPTTAEAVRTMADFVLGRNDRAASDHVHHMLENGVALETIFLEHIEPAAVYLKQLWTDDERDFADITLGLWRLQHLLREFSMDFRATALPSNGQRALLSLVPGETHELPYLMFKLVLSGEFFRHDGWDIWIEPDSTHKDLMSHVGNEWFDTVEFLINSEKRLDLLVSRIKTIRNDSLNRSVCIALAGPAVQRRPELVSALGGDVMAVRPGDPHTPARYMSDASKRRDG